MQNKISVIIPTYNGANKLPIILESLQKQTTKNFEVIVVVDGSTDNTIAVLDSFKSKFESFRIIEQDNKGRAAVRNSGARIAKSELLVFFDDDLLLDNHCVAEHINHHASISNSIMTGGLRDSTNSDTSEFLIFRQYLGKKWTKDLIINNNQQLTQSNFFVMAANLSMSKEVFFKLNGFDENLNDAEDFDFGVRAWNLGIPMFFNNNASATHYDHPTTEQYLKRLNQYRAAREQLVHLKPELYLNYKKINVQPPVGLKKTFFQLFRSPWWVSSIEKKTWKWLPQEMKYKLYDYIITANSIF